MPGSLPVSPANNRPTMLKPRGSRLGLVKRSQADADILPYSFGTYYVASSAINFVNLVGGLTCIMKAAVERGEDLIAVTSP